MPNDNGFKISLYLDDLEIFHRHLNWRVAERKLQDCIHIDEKLIQKNGFRFFTSKTFVPLIKLSIPSAKELRLDNIRIKKPETVKYLGLTGKLTYSN